MTPETSFTKPIRTRFAPSPTGFVHIGSLRTALFSFLFARHFDGVNILRVEDTDQTRLVEGSVKNMLTVLATNGISFDEGIEIENDSLVEKGEYGPYVQSKRLEIYHSYRDELIAKKAAYYCFCSAERLDELRKEQTALKQAPMYDKLCRNLTEENVASKLKEFTENGKNAVVRQANPSEDQTIVKDLVYGDISYENALLDDHVLIKSDGFPTYHFAVVVDDHEMQITHVIRGEEWLPSTPKHVLLYTLFGWEPPQYAHLPLILNPDKSKLSKRQGDVAVEDFLKKGYLPEALVNFVAFLGWNPKTEQEIFSMEELISQFDLSKVNKSGAVLDIAKLEWMNGEYIRQKSSEELVALCKPYWTEAGIELGDYDEKYLQAIIGLEKDRLKKLSEITERTEYFFVDAPQLDAQKLVWKKSTRDETKQNLRLLQDLIRITSDEDLASVSKLEEIVKAFIAEHELDTGAMLWPLRYAMTGEERSPSPFEVTVTLFMGKGRENIMHRLEKAIATL